MPELSGSSEINAALRLLGELLEARGERFRIVVIGGAAVNLLGLVSRATTDVDILAFASPGPSGIFRLGPPDEPLPAALLDAARTVARDMGLDPHWLNTGPAPQWRTGLPPGLETRVHWLEYSALTVGVAGRYDLIFFKLWAAADHPGPKSVHFQDLLQLSPTDEELAAAHAWISQQDPSPGFATDLSKAVSHVRDLRNRAR